jgi:hypothetical protein
MKTFKLVCLTGIAAAMLTASVPAMAQDDMEDGGYRDGWHRHWDHGDGWRRHHWDREDGWHHRRWDREDGWRRRHREWRGNDGDRENY